MSLKILSVNCRGLHGDDKRINFFKCLKEMNYDIYCLQDTHFTTTLVDNIKKSWKGTWFFSCNSSTKRGVAIIFGKALKIFDVETKTDLENGNYVMVKFNTKIRKSILLCSVYGPNEDNPSFYNKLQENLKSFKCESVILCGDFNLVLNPDLEYENYVGQTINFGARECVKTLMKDENLVDIFS